MTGNPEVLGRLREQIRSGEFQPGDPVNEVQLARRMGVSPTPVREAIWQLIAEGYIEGGDNRRRRIARLSPRRAVELAELLAVLIPVAVEKAGYAAPGSELDELADCVDRIADGFASEDRVAATKDGHEFSRSLGQACRQRHLAWAMDYAIVRTGPGGLSYAGPAMPWRLWATRFRWIAELFRERQIKTAARQYGEAMEDFATHIAQAIHQTDPVESPQPRPAGAATTRQAMVIRRLRSDIVSGVLQPGEPVREVEIARRYQVSATPVREAIRVLLVTGLIEGEPNRSRRVATLSDQDVTELAEVARPLVTRLLDRGLPDLPEDVFDMLTETARSVPQHFYGRDAEAFSGAIYTLFETIGRAGQNDQMWSLLELIMQRTMARWLMSKYDAAPVLDCYTRLGAIPFPDRVAQVPAAFAAIIDESVRAIIDAG